MTKIISCPCCQKKFSADETYSNKRITCDECGQTFTAPIIEEEAEDPPKNAGDGVLEALKDIKRRLEIENIHSEKRNVYIKKICYWIRLAGIVWVVMSIVLLLIASILGLISIGGISPITAIFSIPLIIILFVLYKLGSYVDKKIDRL